MEIPHSLRLGNQGGKLSRVASRTGLKQPDIVKLAIEELFRAYPDDKSLATAVIEFRVKEAKKSTKG